MGLIPGFKYDIFFSFAHADDTGAIDGDDKSGWIGATIELIKRELRLKLKSESQQLGRKLEVFFSYDVNEGELLNPQVEAAVNNSAFFVAFMSKSFLNSRWCTELESGWFNDRLQVVHQQLILLNSELESKWPAMLLHVGPTVRAQRPQMLQGVTGYRFYHEDRSNMDPRYNAPSPKMNSEDNNAYSKSLNKLLFELRSRIVKAVKHELEKPDVEDTTPPTEKHDEMVVILASREFKPNAEKLAVECKSRDLHPREFSNASDIHKWVGGGATIVTLLGFSPPDEPLLEWMRNARKIAEKYPDQVIFSTGPDYDLSLLKQLPSSTFGEYCGLIDGVARPIEKLDQPTLEARLFESIDKRRQLPVAVEGSTGPTVINLYLDTDPQDRDVARTFAQHLRSREIADKLAEQKIDVFTMLPDNSGDQRSAVERFEKCIPMSEGVILVHGNTSEESIPYKLLDIREIETRHGGKKTKGAETAVLFGPPHKHPNFVGNFQIIKQSNWEKLNSQDILSFITKLAQQKNRVAPTEPATGQGGGLG